MSLLIFILIVLVILALVMWVIYYVPLPPGSPIWIKNILYIVVLVVALVMIIQRVGLADAHAETLTPTPMQRFVRAAWQEPYGPQEAAKPPPQHSQYGDWRRFQGATRCEQTPDGVLTCDNGYKGRGR